MTLQMNPERLYERQKLIGETKLRKQSINLSGYVIIFFLYIIKYFYLIR